VWNSPNNTTQAAFQVWSPKSGRYSLIVLLMMGILVPETCWGNKTAHFVASSWLFTFTVSMMHGHMDSSGKCFVAWILCDMNPFLCFCGSAQQLCISDSHVSMYSSTNGNGSLHFHGIDGYINTLKYFVIGTWPLLFSNDTKIPSQHAFYWKEG
jgi:hypothetical protein